MSSITDANQNLNKSNHINKNQLNWVQQILQSLIYQGVAEFVICPGSRNAPFVEWLSRVKGVQVWWGFEERAMAFFALGRARRLAAPVALITTSGTAVSETHSAIIEAFYSGVGLGVISCDRPRVMVGTGAPQTIDQTQIFNQHAHFYRCAYSAHNEFSALVVSKSHPWHLNVHLDEPLIAGIEHIPNQWTPDTSPNTAELNTNRDKTNATRFEPIMLERAETLVAQSRKPVLYVGPLTAEHAQSILPTLAHINMPLWLEAASQLREAASLQDRALLGSDHCNKLTDFDLVIRLGGVPTSRIWRDLDRVDKPVISFVSPPFASGTSRVHPTYALQQWPEFAAVLKRVTGDGNTEITKARLLKIAKSNAWNSQLNTLMQNAPQSEPALLSTLSKIIPEHSNVYLGNSLPIRIWDWAAARTKKFNYGFNRGVNGIDGQLSTFLGWSDVRAANWAILGDLTLLYDLAAFWPTQQLSDTQLRIVIINNGGGKIFSRLYQNPRYCNSHHIEFSGLAKMWGWSYVICSTPADIQTFASNAMPHVLMELKVSLEQTDTFYKRLKDIQ